MNNGGFIFLKSYYEAISSIDEPIAKLEMYDAITNYVFNGVEPSFKTLYLNGFWMLIKPTIDSSLSKYKASVSNGKSGGRPRKKTQPKPSNNPAITQTKPNNNPEQTQVEPEKNLDKDKDIDKEKDIDKDKAIPPIEDFISFAKEHADRNGKVESEAIDYVKKAYEAYTRNGWKDAHGNPVINWKNKLCNSWLNVDKLKDKPRKKTTQEVIASVKFASPIL